jgi:hypothetical protein
MLSSAVGSATRFWQRTAMRTICTTRRLMCAMLALCALSLTELADASSGDLHQSSSPAKVIAHLRLSDGGARRMFLRQDGKARYLYLQRVSQPGLTVVDVTNPGRPKVVRPVPLETRTVMGAGFMITETPGLSAAVRATGAARKGDIDVVPESVHVLNVGDPAPSRTVQGFSGAASTLQDPVRNLIYVVNGDGVWILSARRVLNGDKCSSTDAISSNPDCN